MEVHRKFAVLAGTATLVGTLSLTVLLTLPGGYYDGAKEIPTVSPHIPNRTSAFPFPFPSPPPPPPDPHKVGESKLSDTWSFNLIMYSAGYGLLLSMFVIVVYMTGKGEELWRWNNAYIFCRNVMWGATFLSFEATIMLIISIIGCHTNFAVYMGAGGLVILFGSVYASYVFWIK